MPKIVATTRIFDETAETLRKHGDLVFNESRDHAWTRDETLAECQNADAVMVFMPDRIDAAFLTACPNLKIVACALKGFDNFDIDACTAAGVWASIVPDLLTEPTAELTVGLMISLARNIPAGDRQVRSGAFVGWRPTLYGTGLANSTVGLLGFGAVGQAVAERLQGFGATLLYNDTAPNRDTAEGLNTGYSEYDELLEKSDFVVVCLPLSDDTLHLVDSAAIARMKPGSFLINPGRGSVVDEAAVADALARGKLAGYAADVFEFEDWARTDRPNEVSEDLRGDPDRPLFTPHIGSAVTEVRMAIERQAAENIVAVLSGKAPPDAINRV